MKIEIPEKLYGLGDPSAFFDQKSDEGNEETLKTRQMQKKGKSKREPRTWGVIRAASLVGRTRAWLSGKHDTVSASGQGRFTLQRINELREQANTLYRRPEGSEPFVIALSKLKGGVGNTTVCVHFAHYLAMMGLKILVVDMDYQSSATTVLGGFNPDIHLEDEDTPRDALLHSLEDYPATIRKTYFHNVFLAPCNSSLQDMEMELAQQLTQNVDQYPVDAEGNPVSPYDRLKVALEPIKHDFDVILIDCAPSLGMLTSNALSAADCLINPLKPSGMDRASYSMFNASLSSYYDAMPKSLRYFRLVLSQYRQSNATVREELILRNIYEDYVLTNVIMDNTEIKSAPSEMATVYELEKPQSNKETYNRALKTLNGVFDEMLEDFKAIWEMEAEDNG